MTEVPSDFIEKVEETEIETAMAEVAVSEEILPAASDAKELIQFDVDSVYTTEEQDYLGSIAQLCHPYPSGDIKEGRLAIRLWSLSTGKIVVAIVVTEMPDSYITVLPYSMTPEEDMGMTIKRLSPAPVVRIYKNILGIMSVPPLEYTLPYLKIVKRNTTDLPGFFNEIRIAQLDSLIFQLEENTESEKEVPIKAHRLASEGTFTPPEFLDLRTKH